MKRRDIYKNLSLSLITNIYSLLIAIIVTFILPKILSPIDYGKWQLYIFYYNYLKYFHFGLGDGIYLRYFKYSFIKILIKIREQVILLYLGLFVVEILSLIIINIFSSEKIYFYLLIMLFIVPYKEIIYLIAEMTGELKVILKGVIIERTLYLVFIFIFYYFKLNINILIFLTFLSHFCGGIYVLLMSNGIKIFRRKTIKILKKDIEELKININVGLRLRGILFFNTLNTGILKIILDKNYGVSYFGYISLTFSLIGVINFFINSINSAIYSIFVKEKQEELKIIYSDFRILLEIISIIILMLVPIGIVLGRKWFSNYTLSLKYFEILVPSIIFELKNSLLNLNFIKLLRLENKGLKINIKIVTIFIFGVLVINYLFQKLEMMLYYFIICTYLKKIFFENEISKKIKVSYLNNIVIELISLSIYIIYLLNIINFKLSIIFYFIILIYFLYRRRIKI